MFYCDLAILSAEREGYFGSAERIAELPVNIVSLTGEELNFADNENAFLVRFAGRNPQNICFIILRFLA
jgi:hypothetical protein